MNAEDRASAFTRALTKCLNLDGIDPAVTTPPCEDRKAVGQRREPAVKAASTDLVHALSAVGRVTASPLLPISGTNRLTVLSPQSRAFVRRWLAKRAYPCRLAEGGDVGGVQIAGLEETEKSDTQEVSPLKPNIGVTGAPGNLYANAWSDFPSGSSQSTGGSALWGGPYYPVIAGASLVRSPLPASSGAGANAGQPTGPDSAHGSPAPVNAASPRDPALTQEEVAQAVESLKRWEGIVSYLYLDTRGNRTIGIGTHLRKGEKWEAIPFVFKDSGVAASPDDVALERKRVENFRNAFPGDQSRLGAKAYESVTQLRVDPAWLQARATRDVAYFGESLQRLFPKFRSFPGPAKSALLDMVYNGGASGLLANFPEFTKAVLRQDWVTAAEQSARTKISSVRNQQTRYRLLQAANRIQYGGS
jgi:GH24 family phage-related lysozyme (muramidase)